MCLLAAAVLAATLLPVSNVTAAVSQTSAERFEGRDRYQTSVAIAKAYLAEIADNPDRAETRAAIVVSGEDRHAVYAVLAAGLASAFDAPILMTPSDELDPSVGDFVETHSFDVVLLVGGPGVVSSDVERQLLQRTDSVRRVWGADAYATSVAVAAQMGPVAGSAGIWGQRGHTALLANGETVADALVAGPLSYYGEHPLLLTPAVTLDAEVSKYLDGSDIEHVVILGGIAAVSAATEAVIRIKGIAVTRLAGNDRYGTAVAMANELLGANRPDVCFDGSTLGLAVGSTAPDAISSGPLLGERCAPLLLTQPDAVPAVVDAFLTGADALGGASRRLTVVAFGGTAAVTDATLATVRIRALRGEPFAARVAASAGSNVLTVTFNEDVIEEQAVRPEHYLVNNKKLGPDAATQRQYSSISLSGRVVTVELAAPLTAGSLITVVGEQGTPQGRSLIAADATLPALESVFFRVPAAPKPTVADFAGPAIQIVAIAGDAQFVVLVTEQHLRPADRLRNDVIDRGNKVPELTVVDKNGVDREIAFVPSGGEDGDCPAKPEFKNPQGEDIGESCYEDPGTLGANFRYTAKLKSDGARLGPGDVITVAKAALHDQQGNPSGLTRYTVTPHANNGDKGDFAVARAAVGNPRHTQQASVFIRNGKREGTNLLKISARDKGEAAGAAGNDWVVYPYVDPAREEPADSVIDVGVDPVHRVISYTIFEGKVTLAALAAALNANPEFSRAFTAAVVSGGASPVDIDDPRGARLSGGKSSVGLRVQFTDHVQKIHGAAVDFRFNDLAFAGAFLDGNTASLKREDVRCLRRGTTVYLEYTAIDDSLMPRAGTPVDILGDMATGTGVSQGTGGIPVTNVHLPVFNLRHDPAIPAQMGYPQQQPAPTDPAKPAKPGNAADLADAEHLRCGTVAVPDP